MSITPKMYTDAIDREIEALQKDKAFAERHGADDMVPRYEAEIRGMVMAKSAIVRTYRAFQEVRG